jgi:hypothetical protein
MASNDSDFERVSTTDIARNVGATVIDNIVNRGLGKTIKCGYNEAILCRANITVRRRRQYDLEVLKA